MQWPTDHEGEEMLSPLRRENAGAQELHSIKTSCLKKCSMTNMSN